MTAPPQCASAARQREEFRVRRKSASRKLLADVRRDALPDRVSSPIHRAAHEGDLDTLQALVSQGDSHARTNVGETPLICAAGQGNWRAVQILCQAEFGAELVAAADMHGDTALHRAAKFPQAVKLLLAAGAPVEALNNLGDQPIHAAAWHGDVDVLRMLLSANASIQATGHGGEQPLAVAARRGKLEAVRSMLEHGSMLVSALDRHGHSALHAAAAAGEPLVCDCLLLHRASPTEAVVHEMHESARRAHALRAFERESATSLDTPLSPQWADRVARMPPLTKALLGLGQEPSSVSALGLLLEQSNGSAIDSLTKFRNAEAALHRQPCDAVMRVEGALSREVRATCAPHPHPRLASLPSRPTCHPMIITA